jgi:hypothetical protein
VSEGTITKVASDPVLRGTFTSLWEMGPRTLLKLSLKILKCKDKVANGVLKWLID